MLLAICSHLETDRKGGRRAGEIETRYIRLVFLCFYFFFPSSSVDDSLYVNLERKKTRGKSRTNLKRDELKDSKGGKVGVSSAR